MSPRGRPRPTRARDQLKPSLLADHRRQPLAARRAEMKRRRCSTGCVVTPTSARRSPPPRVPALLPVRDRDASRGERVRALGRDGCWGSARADHQLYCTGYGGLDMAVQSGRRRSARGCRTSSPRPARSSPHHPDVPNLGDFTVTDWTTVERVDVFTAGYPCQPFSTAGKRRGTNDERHLWPFVRDAIRATT